jgi:23S rRNA (guanine2535-N1)-methyltransferase
VEYRYARAQDYADYASGSVLRSAPGHPGFPVRLAWELFGRATELVGTESVVLWDPACGSGQLLTTVALGHRDRIAMVLGSDADPAVLPLAEQNLSLLTRAGLDRRRAELAALAEQYGKESHRLAVAAADRLAARAEPFGDMVAAVHRADLLDRDSLAAVSPHVPVDVVLTDLPYGSQTTMLGTPDPLAAVDQVVENLAAVLRPGAVVVLVTNGRKLPPTTRRPVSTLRVGTRVVGFFVC